MAGDAGPNGVPEDLAARLHEAEATIAAQRRELEGLRARQADATFADELRQALIRMGAAGQLTAPVAHNELLDMIIRTAAQVLSAEAASLFLIDHETNELVFEVALGESATVARKFRVPLGQGIAGWVAMSGQPVAVSDASQDPRFAAGIAGAIGYIPKSVLCIPLRSAESIIGVVEIFDKANGQPFTAADMDLLGQFASQAAVAIELSRVVRDLTQLFYVVLQGLLPGGSEEEALRHVLEVHAEEFTERTAQSEQYREALQITQLVSEVSRHGPDARHLCLEIMRSIGQYVRGQAALHSGGGWLS
jgi:GAF domain-containing protein